MTWARAKLGKTALPCPSPYDKGRCVMNLKRKAIVTAVLILLLALVAAGCSFEQSPYALNDSENFNVSIKFDANGGAFTDNAPVIVDSYDISGMEAGADGKVQIPLIAPDDANRGKDAFKPVKNGHFLVGWYAQRTEVTDSEGNVSYTYGEKWDFTTDRVEADPNVQYTSQEPVLTLYAAWAPLYQVEFYDLSSGELLSTYAFDPSDGVELRVPAWNEESGAVDMFKFPSRDGYTYNGAYYDAEATKPVSGDTVTHPGTLSEADAVLENSTLQLYVDWMEGEWYRIYNVNQFLDNYSIAGSYELYADLDFTDENWPTSLMYGSYTGTIRGNGHTIRNVTVEQTNNSKINAGLFGQLASTAVLEDVTFENVTFTLKSGTRMAGTAYGLLAGIVSDGAKVSNVQILSSQLLIDSGCYFGTEDYVIGLVCGMGDAGVDTSGITCAATGDAPEKVNITVDGEAVTVKIGE